jgi:hypothetical protein
MLISKEGKGDKPHSICSVAVNPLGLYITFSGEKKYMKKTELSRLNKQPAREYSTYIHFFPLD